MTIEIHKPRVMSGEELANDLRRISGAKEVDVSLYYSTRLKFWGIACFIEADGQIVTRQCDSIPEFYQQARAYLANPEPVTHGIFEQEIGGDG